MPVLKVHVDSNNQGHITCPKCSKVKSIDATHHLLTKKAIKVRCSCGLSFKVSLDYRRYFRKNIRFPATLYKPNSDDVLSEVTLTSLSVNGIGFETTSLHDIYISSPFEIEFKLDDDSDTHIREAICIKRITGFMVGAEFTKQDKYCFELDFYLAPAIVLG